MPTLQQVQIETIRGWLATNPELIPGHEQIVAEARRHLAEWDAKQLGQDEVEQDT